MRLLPSTCALILLAPALFADGGAVLSRQESGPFVITVFAAPVPLRAGPIDMSVMIQDRVALQPVLDAAVSIRVEGVAAAEASRSKAQNKLLYAASVTLPRAGEWKYAIAVRRSGVDAKIRGVLQAGPPAPPLASYAFYLALPPLFIAIFTLHQWLSSRLRRASLAKPCATINP
jgi:hypothetical protein